MEFVPERVMLWTEATIKASDKLTNESMKILERIVNGLILIRWVMSVRNAAGYNNLHQSLIIGVHSVGELPDSVVLMEDHSEVQVGPDKLEAVASFCFLGDMLSVGGGYELAISSQVKTAWKLLLSNYMYCSRAPSLHITWEPPLGTC